MRIALVLFLVGCASVERNLDSAPHPSLKTLCYSDEVFMTDEGPKRWSDTKQCKEAIEYWNERR